MFSVPKIMFIDRANRDRAAFRSKMLELLNKKMGASHGKP